MGDTRLPFVWLHHPGLRVRLGAPSGERERDRDWHYQSLILVQVPTLGTEKELSPRAPHSLGVSDRMSCCPRRYSENAEG